MLLQIMIAVEEPVFKSKLLRLLARADCAVQVIEESISIWKEVSRKIFDIIIISHRIVSGSAVQDIRGLQELPDAPWIIVITDNENPQERANLLAAGCTAVLDSRVHPRQIGDALNTILANRRKLTAATLDRRPAFAQATLNDFSSKNPAMEEFVRMARQVVNSNSPVLVLGETGVGKERLARAIHTESGRSDGPFVAVNCGAMPETLLESEIFGHDEGAFTGATRSHRGCFEMAHRGTLFLDEIGEIPLHLQVKLLSVLESREIRRVGSEKSVGIDVRIMAATNRDLEEAVRQKQFRADLFYRLNVVTLLIPPLRERCEDIPALVEKYIHFLRPRVGKNVVKIAEAALDKMVWYAWPGNVRELINVIERAMLLCPSDTISLAELPSAIRGAISSHQQILQTGRDAATPIPSFFDDKWTRRPLKEIRNIVFGQVERAYLEKLLSENNGKLSPTAQKAGIDRRTLFKKMKQYSLFKESFRQPSPNGGDPDKI